MDCLNAENDAAVILVSLVVSGAEWMHFERVASDLKRACAFDDPSKMDRFDREVAIQDLESLHEAVRCLSTWRDTHMEARTKSEEFTRKFFEKAGKEWTPGQLPKWLSEALGGAS